MSHLGHTNVLKYDNRPFANINLMDETILKNFEALTEQDHLFFLGDLSFEKNHTKVINQIKRLRCKLYWVIGNHDTPLLKSKELCELFQWVLPLAEIYVTEIGQPKQKIVLCHYALKVWNKSHHGSYHAWGHSHGSLSDDPNSLSCDVGCMLWDYKPVSYFQFKKKMLKKTYKSIDHHNKETN